MRKNVLIVHHTTERVVVGKDKFDCKESNASVLDEVEPVAAALEHLGFTYRIKGIKEITELPDILRRSPEKIVFNLIEDLNGHVLDFCKVPAVCRAYGKVCTGGDTPCLLLTQDKWRTKAVLKAANLPCPDGVIVPIDQKIHLQELERGKYIVKPVFSDASEGIDAESVVDLPSMALHRAVKRIHKQLEQPAIVEQFIPGRELNVSVLQRNGRVEVLPIAEIDFSAFGQDYPHIVDYSAKWMPGSFVYQNSPRIIPTRLPDQLAESVHTYAIAAWHFLGCQDFARVDFRLDENDNIFILEVNPNPDISLEAGFVAALTASEIKFEEFIKILLDNASARLGEEFSDNESNSIPKKKQPRINIRQTCSEDRPKILSVLKETNFFRNGELAVAQEVLDTALTQGADGDYQSFVAEDGRNIIGWVCFGPTPCTLGTFDIYWLVVAPEKQHHGIGSYLMQYATNLIEDQKGRMIVVETSGSSRYLSTRRFYERMGYFEASRVKDFYTVDDDKVIYVKHI
jgi:D-alanine-D-alanine ligase